MVEHIETPAPIEAKTPRRPGRLASLLFGLLIGILLVLAIRFVSYHEDSVHYHANFAVYINGQREAFKDPQYYEEVKLCSLGGATPQSRTHMHDEESGVIHVHDAAVTWGQFFENLGWIVGPNFVQTRDKLYVADDSNKLNLVLNGQNITGLSVITDQVINDKDRLLVSYGPADTAVLKQQYQTVPASASSYDTKPDPASCAGNEAPTIGDRFKHLL